MCSVTHEVRAHVGWMEGEVVGGPDQREEKAGRMCRRWQEVKEERPSVRFQLVSVLSWNSGIAIVDKITLL